MDITEERRDEALSWFLDNAEAVAQATRDKIHYEGCIKAEEAKGMARQEGPVELRRAAARSSYAYVDSWARYAKACGEVKEYETLSIGYQATLIAYSVQEKHHNYLERGTL